MKQNVMLIVLNSSYGGAEKHVFDLVKHMDRQTIDLTVVLPTGSKLASLVEHYLDKKHIVNVERGIQAIWKLKKLVEVLKPDIVHLHSPRATFIGMVAKTISRQSSNVFVTAHGWIPDRLKLRKVYEFLYVSAIKRSDRIIAVSGQVKDMLMAYKLDESKISVIHNGIEVPPQIEVTKRQIAKKRFVFLGRMIEEKGISYLLEAIEQVDQKYPEKYHLDFYGDGPLAEMIKETLKHKQIQNVTLHGFVQPEQVIPLLNQYDAFLMPSVQEGFPYTLIEAFAAGLMVIGTDVGGIKEALIDNENGYLIPAKDVDALIYAMTKVITMSDEELLNFRNLARERSHHFTIEKMTSSLVDEYVFLRR
ncbi:glycosyltransferase family 4 protein [Bacillus sp. V5-8f]|uniref:glycosyltransferase family 4 protein n=1 Tax=Bacillus sp. V5-8f TaxID=2053044 RepID=UPI000C7712A6|nr:glycosyltransferase family 4 protein [Bacillus sp. V5-8f]PLT35746.1 hypothetical protein CUU64_00240 [Bacillus sp. V5-8f]